MPKFKMTFEVATEHKLGFMTKQSHVFAQLLELDVRNIRVSSSVDELTLPAAPVVKKSKGRGVSGAITDILTASGLTVDRVYSDTTTRGRRIKFEVHGFGPRTLADTAEKVKKAIVAKFGSQVLAVEPHTWKPQASVGTTYQAKAIVVRLKK